MITENLSTLKIHKLTQAQYDRELANGTLDPNAIYLTPDEEIDIGSIELITIDDIDAICRNDNVGTINGIHIITNEYSITDDGDGNVVITAKEV